MKEKTKSVNVPVPEALHKRLKVAVANECTSIACVIRQLLEQWLGKAEK